MSDSFEPEVRVLEIGRIPLFKSAYPDQTTWIRTGSSLVQKMQHISFRRAPKCLKSQLLNF
jgi:hypothetical protein